MVKEYESNLRIQAQQQEQRTRGAAIEERAVGEEHFFEYISPVTPIKLTTRHADTPQIDTPHVRRRVTPNFYVHADFVDDTDKVRILIDPASQYSRNMVMGMNRQFDQEFWDAYYGTAFTGKTGSTQVTFPAGNEIAVGGTGLTKAKIQNAKRLLMANEAADGRLFIGVTARQIDNLFDIDQLTSIDFNTIKPLRDGKVVSWMGFNFIHSELLPLSGGDRRCPAWSEFGMGFAIWEDIFTRIGERPDKNYLTQVYARTVIGATRLEENRCMSILCDEP
jgi:hypothetical protein